MKRVLILGCTGSIGTNALNIINNMNSDFCVCGLQAHSNKDKLEKLKNQYNCPTLLTSENNSEKDFLRLYEESKPDISTSSVTSSEVSSL